MSAFIHTEAQLVETLGLARKQVRAVRADELTNGVDWKHEGGQVRYSHEGREKLLLILKISSDPSARAPAAPVVLGGAPDARTAPTPGEEHELVVTRKYLNRAIVQAKFGGALVRVRVKDSRTLVGGMFIRCQLIEGDLWKMTQRLPRAVARQN